jgi:hypothetical protein
VSISFAKHRLLVSGFCHCIYGASAPFLIPTPVGDKAPAQRLHRPFAGLVLLPNDENFLTGCAIVAPRNIVEPVIVNVETVEDRVFHGAGGLNDASTHVLKVVMTGVVVK